MQAVTFNSLNTKVTIHSGSANRQRMANYSLPVLWVAGIRTVLFYFDNSMYVKLNELPYSKTALFEENEGGL